MGTVDPMCPNQSIPPSVAGRVLSQEELSALFADRKSGQGYPAWKEVRNVSNRTARTSPSRHLEAVPNRVRFDELVRRVRRENRWTQAQLAERLGVRAQTVSAWERGTKPQRRQDARPDGETRDLPSAVAAGRREQG
jgi:DNA-binding XRE family transcriptional regulator